MVTGWSKTAELQLKKAFLHIRKHSYQNAIKLRNDIVTMVESLSVNPERFPPDKFKTNNDGSYRAFELHHYRISFVILKEVVLIVRMRYTAMSPLVILKVLLVRLSDKMVLPPVGLLKKLTVHPAGKALQTN